MKRCAPRVVVVAVLALASFACANGPSPETPVVLSRSSAVVGTEISSVTFERFDGTVTSFDHYRGQLLVVNLFGNWCPTCVVELPEFEAVSRDLDGQVTFVGISVTESVNQAEDLLERTGVTFDVGRDPTGAMLPLFGAVTMPTTLFVASDGTILASVNAALDAESLRAAIDDAFGLARLS